MGLTPLAGLPMGTRAGDMDVGVVEFIANKYDMTISCGVYSPQRIGVFHYLETQNANKRRIMR